jgi:hypothetical protein
MASHSVHPQAVDEERSWAGDFDPFSDPEERRVLFAAFDSFRWVELNNAHTGRYICSPLKRVG